MATEPKKTKGTGSAPVETTAVSTYDWSATGVNGFEAVNQEDLGIPFLSIIQKGSPQYDRDHKDHALKKIEGCDVGDIFNSVANVVVGGEGDPIEVVPVFFQKTYIEWKPNNGGIVKVHYDARILDECKRNEKGSDVLPSGNEVVTTASFYCVALIDGAKTPCVISFTSTQLKKSKFWLNMMTSLKVARPDGSKYTPPMFSHSYKLGTTPEKNEKGTWRGWTITMGSQLNDPVLIAQAIDYSKRAAQIQRGALPPPSTSADQHLS